MNFLLRLLLLGLLAGSTGCHYFRKTLVVDTPEVVRLRTTLTETKAEFERSTNAITTAQDERLVRIAVANEVIKHLALEPAVPEPSRIKILHQTEHIDKHVPFARLSPGFDVKVSTQLALLNTPEPPAVAAPAPAAPDTQAAAAPAASPAPVAVAAPTPAQLRQQALIAEETDARAIDAKLAGATQASAAAFTQLDAVVTSVETSNEARKTDMQKRFKAYEAEITRLREKFEKFKKGQLEDEQKQVVRVLRWTGIGMLVIGIGVIAATKGTQIVRGLIFCGGGGGLICAAILVSSPAFPYVLWGALILGTGGLGYWLYHEHICDRNGRAGDDVIAAVEEIRTKFKTGTDELNEVFETYAVDNDLPQARYKLRKNVIDKVLGEWVTEDDGTARIIDQRRRAQRLIP
jgi:hypothetical protein